MSVVGLVTSAKASVITIPRRTAVLDCNYLSDPFVALSVTWTFQNTTGATQEVNVTKNPSKYGGSTLDSPSLAIFNFSQSDEGQYNCIVEFTEIGAVTGPDVQAHLLNCK